MKFLSILLISGLFFTGCRNKELPSKYLSNIPVVRETESSRNLPKDAPSSAPVYTQTPVHQISNARYHIIVASFGTNERSRAEKLVQQLKSKNYPATLITSSQRYRVSIENFTSETEANAARDEYRAATDRQDIWIYKTE